MSEKQIFADYAFAEVRARESAILAAGYAAIASPFLYWGVSKAKVAGEYHSTGQLVSRQLEKAVNDSSWPASFHIAENGNYAISRGFQSEQAARDYVKLCNDSSLKEGALSAGCFLAYVLPIALLARRFFKNLGLKRKYDKVVLEERLRMASMNTGQQ